MINREGGNISREKPEKHKAQEGFAAFEHRACARNGGGAGDA